MNIRFAREDELEQVNQLRRQVNDVHVQGRPDIFKPGFPIELQNYLFNTDVRELAPRNRLDITNALRKEMIEIFSGRNVFGNG